MFQDYYADRDHRSGGERDGQQVCPGAAQLKPGVVERAGGVRLRLALGLGGLDYSKPRPPEFEEVALADIKAQWLSAQRAETKRQLFTAMRAHYEIVLPQAFFDMLSWVQASLAAALSPEKWLLNLNESSPAAINSRSSCRRLSLQVAQAHESRPAYLEINETIPGRYDVLWRTPLNSGMPLPIVLKFPGWCREM